jgi:hypothetical protein
VSNPDPGSTTDGGDPSVFPVCPAEPPRVGAACSSPGEGCKYVTLQGACEAYACEEAKWRDAPEGC